MEITEVIRKHAASLMATPGVVGVAESEADGKPCVMIMLAEDRDPDDMDLPSQLEGYPVILRVTGEFTAFDDDA